MSRLVKLFLTINSFSDLDIAREISSSCMSWQEGVAFTVVLLGLGAGTFLVAQRPSFWTEFEQRLAKALLPLAWKYASKRMPPEDEAAWRQAERRGQGKGG